MQDSCSSPAASPRALSGVTGAGADPRRQHAAVELVAHCSAQRSVQHRADASQRVRQARRFFTSAHWTADGTSILATSSDDSVASFVVPEDLLEASAAPRLLAPQATRKLPGPAHAIASAPYFSLANSASQTFLAAYRDHPIHLYDALEPAAAAAPLAAYKLIRSETEEYITPSSLCWAAPGSHFVCGSANRLDYFDLTRPGPDGPVLTIPTIPSKRHLLKGGGVGFKGTVSALALSPRDADGGSILAAGARTRWIGLYDLDRSDKSVANFSVASADEEVFGVDLGGRGIVQVLWSPCGRYLIVNERHSDGLLVYDVRGTGRVLSILRGRKTDTQQRLSCDVYQGQGDGAGSEVWAGSQDGFVLVWEKVGWECGVQDPRWSWEAHQAPVGSTFLHRSGSVAATCSGGWRHSADVDIGTDGGTTWQGDGGCKVVDESTLKLWSLVSPA